MIFSKKNIDKSNILPILLEGKELPYVDSMLHLGNTLQSNNSMEIDILKKRSSFIGKVNSLNQEFYYCTPDVRTKIIELFCTSYYSSSLWDLFSKNCDKLFKSFNVSIRIINNIDRKTHRYFIEHLINTDHPQVMCSSRFVKFYNTLLTCSKPSVRILAKVTSLDANTVLYGNLQNIATKCNIDIELLTPMEVKQNMLYFPTPVSELWRISFLKELLLIKSNEYLVDYFDNTEFDDILEYLCTT